MKKKSAKKGVRKLTYKLIAATIKTVLRGEGCICADGKCCRYDDLMEATWERLREKGIPASKREIFELKFRQLLLVLYPELGDGAAIRECGLTMRFCLNAGGEDPDFD